MGSDFFSKNDDEVNTENLSVKNEIDSWGIDNKAIAKTINDNTKRTTDLPYKFLSKDFLFDLQKKAHKAVKNAYSGTASEMKDYFLNELTS